MAERLESVAAIGPPIASEENILLWLQNEFSDQGITHEKYYAFYLLLLLKNYLYFKLGSPSIEAKKDQKNQTKKARRFLLSRQRSKSFNCPNDAIQNMQSENSETPSRPMSKNLNSKFPMEAVQLLIHLGCTDKKYISSLLNELSQKISSLMSLYMIKTTHPYPIVPGQLKFLNPHLLKPPATLSEQDLYHSAFPALVPGISGAPLFHHSFFLANIFNNPSTAWLTGPPIFSKAKSRSPDDIDEGFAEEVTLSHLVQDLRVKQSDVVDKLNIELPKPDSQQWKPLIKTRRKRNTRSCSFPQKSQCYIYDQLYEEDRVLNSGSQHALTSDSNKKEEEEMLQLIMKTVEDQRKDEVIQDEEEKEEAYNNGDNFKVFSSSCCDLRWVHTHGAGVPALIPFSDNAQSSSQSILYQPQQDESQDETSGSCHFDLLSDQNKALSRIWERQLYRRRLGGSIGLDDRVIRSSRKGRTVSCSEPLQESSIPLLTKLKESCDDTYLPPLPATALQAKDLEKLWAMQSPIDKSKRACSFLLRGRCRKEDCQFAHNLRHVTCRFWQAGECFKGDDCPFRHGYFFLPVTAKS